MKDIAFGGCLFKFSTKDGQLFLHTRDTNGIDHIHLFHLKGAFLVNIGGNYWRFVTGVCKDLEARYLFEDVGVNVQERVNALGALGVPVLNKEEGKRNLDLYKLPVKRLMLTS